MIPNRKIDFGERTVLFSSVSTALDSTVKGLSCAFLVLRINHNVYGVCSLFACLFIHQRATEFSILIGQQPFMESVYAEL